MRALWAELTAVPFQKMTGGLQCLTGAREASRGSVFGERKRRGEMIHSNWMGIVSSLLVGLAATLGTMVIHGLVVHTVIMQMRRDLLRGWLGGRLWVNLTFVSGPTLLALAGHILEVALWAFVFELCGGVADFSSALYCSAGSYTTVGSGDVVLSPRWKMLVPLEAAAGLLMFGVSTALIFAVIQRLIQARLAGAERK